jgi:hypothetical protein
MNDPRQVRWLEERIGMLEDQKRAWASKSYEIWKQKVEKIEAYNDWFRSMLNQHPELQEAWDSFACLYQLAVNKPLLEDAQGQRKGCYLCWSEEQIASTNALTVSAGGPDEQGTHQDRIPPASLQ